MRTVGAVLVGLAVLTNVGHPSAGGLEPSSSPRPTTPSPGSPGERAVVDAYRTLPLRFEANRGQTDGRVKFLARHGAQTLFLGVTDAVLRVGHGSGARPVQLTWLGANTHPAISGVDPLPGPSNYLVGAHPAQWHTEIPTYAKVRYAAIYPGIDLLYYGNGEQLEYDLVVAPGARPEQVRLQVRGADRIRVNDAGDLIVTVGSEQLRLHQPVAYQDASAGTGGTGTHTAVPVRFVVTRRHEVRFAVGAYDRTRPLVIDPQLTYSSYLGGSSNDVGWKIAVDTAGFAYIVGQTASVDFPVLAALQSTNGSGGGTNAFIAKLNPALPGAASLVFSTYLGGSGAVVGRSIAVNAAGEIFVAGDTNSPNFPVTAGAYQTACKNAPAPCSNDVFAAKLNAAGNALLYSTYLGGTGDDFGFGLAIDGAGHLFITGPTASSNLPTTAGAFQTTFGGGGAPFGDTFVAELNPAGGGATDLLYATYLGGTGSEQGWAIAVDGSSNIYVGGSTTSSNFPTTATAFSKTFSGAAGMTLGDAFFAKLRPAGTGAGDLLYSTYLGGSSDDRVESIAVDSKNLAYLTGLTTSSNFPLTAATAFQTTFGGGTCPIGGGGSGPCPDVFLAKVDATASGAASLPYSTFFGGSSFDLGHSIAVDKAGFVYVTGESASTNLPTRNPIQGSCFGGCPGVLDDLFLAKFDLSRPGPAGLLFSTYLGGADVDTAWGLAVDAKGYAYVTGHVFSPNFPTRMPFQATCNTCLPFPQSGDAFLAKVWIGGSPGFDFDNDLATDIAVYRGATGQWFILNSRTGTGTGVGWGAPSLGDISVAGDYDGDGRTDVAVYRGTTGQWFIANSSGGMTAAVWGEPARGDIPVPADYDRDGRTDIAVYRSSTGQWWIAGSRGGITVVTWGAPSLGDIPVPADYDGDGRADIAVYRNTTGQWFILNSLTGAAIVSWGAPSLGDIPVPADYDGDGRADIAVFRNSTGEWFIANTSGGTAAVAWGAPSLGDMPVPADYDGDGKADIAVYRQSTGAWIVNRSSGGASTINWGAPSLGDIPVDRPQALR